MYFVLLLVGLCVASGSGSSSAHYQENWDLFKIQKEWKSFKATYHKTYKNPDEERFRMKVFMDNKRLVDEHNKLYESGKSTYKMGVNKFTDQTNDEFNNQSPCTIRSNRTVRQVRKFSSVNIPDSIDWRDQGAVTPVKDQGPKCGSCWAFSTTGTLEGQIFLKTNQLISFSEQNLIDCVGNGNDCGGGNVDEAFEYIENNGGLETTDTYSYTGVNGDCHYDASNSGGVSTAFIELDPDEDQLTQALANIGPISVAINQLPSFRAYQSGVYSDDDCKSDAVSLNHCMLVVGYGTDSGNDYYIVKNSWGDGWGEGGYVRMSRNNNNKCGIATEGGYPTV